MTKDLHAKPFDEVTKAKLAIFRDYLREWLPVFIAPDKPLWNTINIFDFFAGPGGDVEGTKGTPLIILDEIAPHLQSINNKNLSVNFYFNEYKKAKYEELRERVSASDIPPYNIEIESLDFRDAFNKALPKMRQYNSANLLFLDQNGVKHITEEVFNEIIKLKQTDFLFFCSSSYIKRFPDIVKHLKISAEEIARADYRKIHKLLLEAYKDLIPLNHLYYLVPYSLKKNTNIYGIIFGSGHLYGFEKFLRSCWKFDPERGEANFDIDEDHIIPGQKDLFTGEVQRPKKEILFQENLEKKILTKQLKTDKDIYLYTLTSNFLPKHANSVITHLLKENKIRRCSLDLSHNICKPNAQLTEIEVL